MNRLVSGFAILITYQFAGEAAVRLLNVPIPGTVAGFALLGLSLLLGLVRLDAVGDSAGLLLDNLLLFFIPTVAGIVLYVDVLSSQLAAVGLSILLSLVIGLLAAGWVTQGLIRLRSRSVRRD